MCRYVSIESGNKVLQNLVEGIPTTLLIRMSDGIAKYCTLQNCNTLKNAITIPDNNTKPQNVKKWFETRKWTVLILQNGLKSS